MADAARKRAWEWVAAVALLLMAANLLAGSLVGAWLGATSHGCPCNASRNDAFSARRTR